MNKRQHSLVIVSVFFLGVFSSGWLKEQARAFFLGGDRGKQGVSVIESKRSDRVGSDFRASEFNDTSGSSSSYSNYDNRYSREAGARVLASSRTAATRKMAGKAIDTKYQDAFSWSYIAQLIREGSYSEAISQLKHFLESEPYSSPAWSALATIYEKQGRTQQALDAWFRYVEYENDSSLADPIVDRLKQRFLSIVSGQLSGGASATTDPAWTIEKLSQLVEIRSNDGELHWMLASLYLDADDEYQAQYHALMAATDPMAKNRAEKILSQLNGDLPPDDLSIPLIRYGNQYLVEVNIEGNAALLLLDTGASISGVSRSFVNNYPYIVKDSKPIRLNTASGVEMSYLFTVDSLTMQSLAFNNHILALLPMAEQAEFDGLLGVDILGRFDFVIDQDAMQLKLKPRS